MSDVDDSLQKRLKKFIKVTFLLFISSFIGAFANDFYAKSISEKPKWGEFPWYLLNSSVWKKTFAQTVMMYTKKW